MIIDERSIFFIGYLCNCGHAYIFASDFWRCTVKITTQLIDVVVSAISVVANAVLSVYNFLRGK